MIYRIDISRELTSEEVDANFNEVGNLGNLLVTESGKESYTPDIETGATVFKYTLDQDTEILAPSSSNAGDSGTIIIRQDRKGGHAVSFDEKFTLKGKKVKDLPKGLSVINYTVVDDDEISLDVIYSGEDPQEALYWSSFDVDQDVEYASMSIPGIFGVDIPESSETIEWDKAQRYAAVNISGVFGADIPVDLETIEWDKALRYTLMNNVDIFGVDIPESQKVTEWDMSLRYTSANIKAVFA